MATIGYVTKQTDGTYKGTLRTLSIKATIAFVRNHAKAKDSHPDFRILSDGADIGAAWLKTSNEGNEYVSVTFASPEFGGKKLYANLGQAAGQDDEDVFAIIWNPQE